MAHESFKQSKSLEVDDDDEMITVHPASDGNGYEARQGRRVERGASAPEAMSKMLGKPFIVPREENY